MNQYHSHNPQNSYQDDNGSRRATPQLYQNEDSYGGGSATDEGIMEYTPSVNNSHHKYANMPMQQNPSSHFMNRDHQQYIEQQNDNDDIIEQ